MLKPRFKDPIIEHSFSQDGFAVINNFLDLETVKKVKQIFFECCDFEKITKNMYFSNTIEPYDRMLTISDKVKNIIEKNIEAFFEDYRTDLYTLITKNPLKDGYMSLHRDFSITDENKFEYRNVWIPLVNVNKDNGTLFVVPKSKLKEKISERWAVKDDSDPTKYNQYLDDIFILNMNAGDAVIYAEKTLHGSFNNDSSHTRPVIHFGLLHKELSFLKPSLSKNGELELKKTDLKGLLNKR